MKALLEHESCITCSNAHESSFRRKMSETIMSSMNYLLVKSNCTCGYAYYFYCWQGLDPSLKAQYYLTNASEYHYLNQGNCMELDNHDDSSCFGDVQNALSVLKGIFLFSMTIYF